MGGETMLDQMSLELESLVRAPFVTDLDLADEPSLLSWVARPSVKDMVLGAGGSALVHLLIGAAALLLPFIQAPPQPPGIYLTVSLVEMGESLGGSCDTKSSEGASAGPRLEPASPAAQEPAKEPSPEPPKPLKQVERVAAVAAKPVKKAPPPAALKPEPTPAVPPEVREKPSSDTPPTTFGTTAETAGAGATGGGQGAKGTGEGAGVVAAGGASAGAGRHGGEFNADAVDKIPQAVQKVEPVYPPRARKQGVCGKVVLRFLVEPDGHVTRPSIVTANPEGYFEQSALEAIRHWRFKPGLYRGRAVATWVVLPVQFQLTS